MASLSRDPGGRKTIQVVCPDGRRRSIRLGKCSAKDAQLFRVRVESLVSSKLVGRSPDDETSRWLGGLSSKLARSLMKCQLIDFNPAEALGPFIDDYFKRRTDVKASTLVVWSHTQRNLVEHFGEHRTLDSITPGDADEWRRSLARQGLGEPTIRKRCQVAKQFFRAAIRSKLITDNPFSDLQSGHSANRQRDHFITLEVAERVIEACPDNQWRLLFALSRYGGLRCPSEHLALTWSDVNWGTARIRIPSPKTEHHESGRERMIPLFPELKKHLEAVYRESSGEGPIITAYRHANANLRTQLLRIIKRAGLKPWPKLFHNLRASRETELVEEYPLHVVVKWIGNSEPVAMRHYLQVRDEHFARAAGVQVETNSSLNPNRDASMVQNPVQHIGDMRGKEGQSSNSVNDKCRNSPLFSRPVSPSAPKRVAVEGFEPPTRGL